MQTPGTIGTAVLESEVDHRRIEAGRHYEAGAGREGGLGLCDGHNGAGSDAYVGHRRGDRLDRLRRRGGAKGDLGAGQPRVDQGARQRHGVVDARDLDHRDDAQGGDERLEVEAGREPATCDC